MPAMITAAALLLLSATDSFSPLQCPGYILPVRPGQSNCPTTLDDVLTVLGTSPRPPAIQPSYLATQ